MIYENVPARQALALPFKEATWNRHGAFSLLQLALSQLHPRSRRINNSWKISKARVWVRREGWRRCFNGSSAQLSPSKRRENLWREIIYYDKVRKNYESRCGGVCSSARAQRHKPLNESRSPLDFYAPNARGGFFCTLILSKAIFHLFILALRCHFTVDARECDDDGNLSVFEFNFWKIRFGWGRLCRRGRKSV